MSLSPGGTTLISAATEITGDIVFSGNLEIEGRVTGSVISVQGADARVRVMDKGVVEGQIRAPAVIINGLVKGEITSTEHLELAAKAVVQGNIYYRLIEIVKGAQIEGSMVFAGPEAEMASLEVLTDLSAAESSEANKLAKS